MPEAAAGEPGGRGGRWGVGEQRGRRSHAGATPESDRRCRRGLCFPRTQPPPPPLRPDVQCRGSDMDMMDLKGFPWPAAIFVALWFSGNGIDRISFHKFSYTFVSVAFSFVFFWPRAVLQWSLDIPSRSFPKHYLRFENAITVVEMRNPYLNTQNSVFSFFFAE